jgi:hypothetical protein
VNVVVLRICQLVASQVMFSSIELVIEEMPGTLRTEDRGLKLSNLSW